MSLFQWCFSDNTLKYKLRRLLMMLDFFEIKSVRFMQQMDRLHLLIRNVPHWEEVFSSFKLIHHIFLLLSLIISLMCTKIPRKYSFIFQKCGHYIFGQNGYSQQDWRTNFFEFHMWSLTSQNGFDWKIYIDVSPTHSCVSIQTSFIKWHFMVSNTTPIF